MRSQYAEGDHTIFVGEVLRLRYRQGLSPLLYHGGMFYTEHLLGRLSPKATGPMDRVTRTGRRRAAGVGQLDLHLQHFQVVLALEVHLEVSGLIFTYLEITATSLTLQRGQIVRLAGVAAAALVGQDDLQALLGDAGGLLLLAQKGTAGTWPLTSRQRCA